MKSGKDVWVSVFDGISLLMTFILTLSHLPVKMKFLSLLSLASVAAASARSPAAQIPLEPSLILTPSQPLTLDSIPLLGFGTWNLDRENATEAVSWAIQAGYRHIDCAAAYKNQDLVGKGIADGLNKTGLKREDLWITSKLWNDQYDLPSHLNPQSH